MSARTARTLSLVLLALPLAGCAGQGVQSSLQAAADQSRAIDQVWTLMLWVCSAIYVAVIAALAWAIWRRRRAAQREGRTRDPLLARALVAWVVLVVGLLSWFVAASFLADRRLHAGHADLEIRVTAKQWWWQVEYLSPQPDQQFSTANELRLPRDQTARIELRSGDVIHSFWVPALSGKEDLIPGYNNAVLVTPRRAGRYRGQCAEFCGLQHAQMALDVEVLDAAGFAAWRAQQLAPAPAPSDAHALRGAQLFLGSACASCHAVRGTSAASRLGPDLTHLASRRTLAAGALPMRREALRAWLADPQHAKPGNQMPQVPLDPRDRELLLDYLMGLR